MPMADKDRRDLLLKVRHLRRLADAQLDPQLRDAALELADEYEQQLVEADRQNQG